MSDSSPLRSGTVIRISVLVSFLLHAVLVFTFRDAFSSLFSGQEEVRTYTVELIRPPIEEMDMEEKGDVDVARGRQEEKPPAPEESQDTISLDTTDKRYVSYARVIKDRIMTQWTYPREAKDRLMEGRLLVVFSLNKQGNMTQVQVAESSGFDILDREATRAVSSAAPFPPFPDHVTVSRLNIKASFDYRIKSKK